MSVGARSASCTSCATPAGVPSASEAGRGRQAPRGAERERGAGGPAPLGTSRIEFPPPSQERRRERYRRRSESSEWLIRNARQREGLPPVAAPVVDAETGEIRGPRAGEAGWVRPPRVARCSWRVGEVVGVHGGSSGPAHFSGTERCGSIWSCPVCASVIRPQRAEEIGRAVTAHQDAGGSLVFVTLTQRHHRGQRLADTLDTALKGWQRLLTGAPWHRFKKRHAVSGYVRTVEVTYGESGWHPHVHAVFFLDRRPSDAEVREFGDWIHARWASYAKDRTGLVPSRRHGTDVQRVDARGGVIAAYLSKMQDEGKRWDVGAEMARSDVKAGRGSSLVPFELLDPSRAEDEDDDEARRLLWLEYVEATYGRRAITWSRGLKDRFGVEDVTDEEIIEDAERSPLAYRAPGRAYDLLRRSAPEALALVLEAAEREDWETVGRLLPGGDVVTDVIAEQRSA